MKENERLKLMLMTSMMVVLVVIFVGLVDYFLTINNLWFTILIGWMLYKVVKKETFPVQMRRTGGFALFNEDRQPCVLLGEPEGKTDGHWMFCIRHPTSRAEFRVSCLNGLLSLNVRDEFEEEWGIINAKSIDRMIELGILYKPGSDDGGESPTFPRDPTAPRREDSRQSWFDKVLYFLAA